MSTLHGRLDLPELKPIFKTFPDVPVVSISYDQRRPLPNACFVGTVPHGLPEQLLTPQARTEPPYLAFLGRVTPEKGPDHAIRIARACGVPLKLAAKVDVADRGYPVIRPMLAEGGVDCWSTPTALFRTQRIWRARRLDLEDRIENITAVPSVR